MLKDKVIVVIGANGLLGKEFVRGLEKQNAIVVKSDIIDDRNFIKCDITSKNSILNLIKIVKNRYGKIDVVINTAYPRNKNYGRKFEDIEYKDFCENVDLHLGGYFLVTQQFAEFFKQQKYGNIINIASIYGIIPPKFDIYSDNMTMPFEYNAIKHSIIAMTKYIAKYYKGYNLKINSISPGGVFDNQPKEFIEKYKSYALNKGMLDPEDIVGSLVFLCSDMSKYVNGQNVIVDDGWSL